jgi:hypothetical protein
MREAIFIVIGMIIGAIIVFPALYIVYSVWEFIDEHL